VSARVVLVVPCYNEAARLDRPAWTDALARYEWLDLLFVNDGSTDSTAVVLQELQQAAPARVSVLTLATNSGKAEAVRRGLLDAMPRAPLCGFWDADLSAPLSELVDLRAQFARDATIEWVWGIRLRALGRQVTRRALRHYLGRLFATGTSVLLNIDSYDTQCGAKLFRASPWLRTVLSEPFLSRWIFDVEMLTRLQSLLAANAGPSLSAVVFEQPLAVWTHKAGSKVRSGDFIKAMTELLVVRNARRAWHRPVSSETGQAPKHRSVD
jgi:glycosyltransferase involved in cell wall biosynthesis